MDTIFQLQEGRIINMEDRKHTNAGVAVGFIASIIIVIIHVLIDMVNEGSSQGDFVLWFFQLLVYFFIGIIAGSNQYKKQINAMDSLQGIKEAGRGAAIIVSVILWVYIIVRSIALDDAGLFSSLGILFTLLFAIFDFILAMGLGTLGATIIHKKYDFDE
jgi:hypothetical protein